MERFTLRQRVAFLTGGLVFVTGLLLVLFINLIAPIFITRETGVPNTDFLVETVDSQGNHVTIIMETPAPKGYTILQDPGFVRGDPLTVVRFLSIAGLILVVFIDFFAVRWVVKKTLDPIIQISLIAKRITARTLSQHLDYPGVQDEVKDLADAFNIMLQRLETNFNQQGQFISNLAHELRTPLTSLRLNIEALNDDPEATLTDYQDLTKTEERAISRLERLVEDLLLLAKGEEEIEHQPIILGSLFEEILDELAPIAEKHKITLKIVGEIDCEICGDSVLLQHAFSNLVENGILYNRSGGFVEIFVRRGQNQVVVEVVDNGIGIENEVQHRIFERFYRAKDGSGKSAIGKGLGLAIAKHVIELHQGHIEVESNLGAGSKFRVFINCIV